MKSKSVKSLNQKKSVIQTINDIITKGHDGELKVETKKARPDDPFGRREGLPADEAGSEFIIQLPVP